MVSVRHNHAGDLREALRLAVHATTGVTEVVEAMHRRIASGPGELEPLLGASAPGAERDAVVAALNGVLGDWLHRTQSPLALSMRLRMEGSGPRALVLVHGSSMNDRQWLRRGHDHGWLGARVRALQ